MANNSIPDFLRAHTQPEQNKSESVAASVAENHSNFIPEFQENETLESFASQDTDTYKTTETVDTDSTDEQITTEQVVEKYKDALKPRLPRGSKPPFLSLLESVSVITDIEELAGGRLSLDALSQIVKNSRSSSSFNKKLTALRSYGLVETDNQDVKVTSLGTRIVAPESPTAQNSAIKEAFLNIDVFAQIYKQFCGRILPQDEFLVNTFKNLVPKDLAMGWMLKFKESATYARVLLERGDGKFQVVEDIVLSEPKVEISEEEKTSDADVDDQKPENEPTLSQPVNKDAIKTIKLRKSNKEIWLGSDANILQIKFGEDMDFVLALIKLFDLYENGKRFEIKEILSQEPQ